MYLLRHLGLQLVPRSDEIGSNVVCYDLVLGRPMKRRYFSSGVEVLLCFHFLDCVVGPVFLGTFAFLDVLFVFVSRRGVLGVSWTQETSCTRCCSICCACSGFGTDG